MMAASEVLSALNAHDARLVVEGDRMQVFPFRPAAAIRVGCCSQGQPGKPAGIARRRSGAAICNRTRQADLRLPATDRA